MAIVEAASCGLKVVSTKVGGIPEVLPPALIYLSEPHVPSLLAALEHAISDFVRGRVLSPEECHNVVRTLYTWHNVTTRTERVYNMVSMHESKSLRKQFQQYLLTGVYPFLLVIALMYLMLRFLDWYIPSSSIDYAKDYVVARNKNKRLKKR
jgi:phosphatidylinositol glycan class A protein